MEGLRLCRELGRRRRGRMLLRTIRRHARAGRLLHHRILHDPRDGDRWGHGNAHRTGVWRHFADRSAGIPSLDRRSSADRLWRISDARGAVHAGRHRRGIPLAAPAAIYRNRKAMIATATGQTDSPAPLLEARGLCKSFGGVRAVQDISLAILAGAVFAIIGPNGAGKSTLLNLLSGVYQPDSGEIRFSGFDLVGMPAHRRVRHGLARTFQKIRLFKQLSVLENVIAGYHTQHSIPPLQYLFHGAAFREDARRCHDSALELLEFVGLSNRATVLAGSLAYGEQRLLEIARALATSPRLLMIDEPAAGLNATEVAALLRRIASLRERGVTIVLVEHNMDLVMTVADRILVMDYGERLFEGAPGEVQAHPDVIAAYLGAETL